MAIVINGSGTVTGISVGGLPDGIVDAGTVAADVATQAEIDAKLNLAGGTMTGTLDIGVSDTGHDVKFHGATAGCKLFWDESADKLRVEGKTDGSDIFIVTDNAADILNIKSTGVVFNEDSGDRDFRIETDGNANMFFVDGGNNIVRIGAASGGDVAAASLQVAGSTTNVFASHIFHTGDNTTYPKGLQITYTGSAPDEDSDTTALFFRCNDTVTQRLAIASDGDVVNHDNSYGAQSDQRLKDDIVDAASQWADLKAMKIRSFERKDDITQHGRGNSIQIGVIGQELEAAGMDGLVNLSEPQAWDVAVSSDFGTLWTSDDAETKDGDDQVLYVAEDAEVIEGTSDVGDVKSEATHSKTVGEIKSITSEKVRSVKYSVLYMKAIKALQEAMDRIETLETKVTALEA